MGVTNWAGNVHFTADALTEPTSVGELQDLVAAARRIRVLGSGHSFNRIADSEGVLVSVRRLPEKVEIDPGAQTVTVAAGMRFGEVGAVLQPAGLALANLGSLPHISVAGASATGTHGSGAGTQVLAAAVRELTMVTGSGELRTVARASSPSAFDGHVLALGRLGIVTEMVLDVVPTYDVAQTVVDEITDEVVGGRLGEILAAAYSVSIFTTWSPDTNRIWLKERTDEAGRRAPDLWGGRAADRPHHPVPGMPAGYATAQLGEPGPWNERIPHFRLDFKPSAGEELQSEYLVPVAAGPAAYEALNGLRHLINPLLLVGEIRAIAADRMWLSPTAGKDCVAFHFTWIPDPASVSVVLKEIESKLLPLGARPHWGKVFVTPAEAFPALYPHLADFRELVQEHDPEGAFTSALVDEWIGLQPTP